MKYQFKTPPRKFQTRALKKMVQVERGALLLPMRSGKTKVAIDWACVLHLKHGITRILVVTHTPTTFGVWRNEFKKHCPLAYDLRVGAEDYQEDLWKGSRRPDLYVWVLNVQRVYGRQHYEEGWDVVDNKELIKWRPEAIVVDEATAIGNPSAVQSRKLYGLQDKCGVRFKLLLTGTPLHRGKNILDTFGMWKFMDDSVFGTTVTSFRSTFGLFGGFNGKTLLKVRNIKLFRSKIEPHVYQLLRVPYREPVHQVIPVELSAKERRIYDDMVQKNIARIGSRVEVEAPIVLTRLLKEAQIAAGWIRDADKEWHRVGRSLRDSFSVLVGDLLASEVKKIVVYARHLPELRDAAEVLKEQGYGVLLLHGGVPAGKREERIAAFHERVGPIAFVSQIATGSMGIDLSCADTTVYYTLTESLLHKDQADARIRLHGDKRTLTYYYLIPEGTVLETMYLALRAKRSLVEFVMHHPNLIHHRERG